MYQVADDLLAWNFPSAIPEPSTLTQKACNHSVLARFLALRTQSQSFHLILHRKSEQEESCLKL